MIQGRWQADRARYQLSFFQVYEKKPGDRKVLVSSDNITDEKC